MNRALILRRALWATAFFNAGGALLFFFPASLGQLVLMPLPAPILYAWFCAAVIVIFGGLYVWLALQQRPNRACLIVSASGKLAFFAVCLAAWLLDEASGRIMAISTGDLIFATIFLTCMLRETGTDARS